MTEFNTCNLTDEQLLLKIREISDAGKNGELISALIERYLKLIKIKANKVIRSNRRLSADSDDLVSEGFLGLLSAIRTFNEEKGNFSPYANICIDNRIKTAAYGYKPVCYDENFDIFKTPDKQLTEELVIEKENENEIAGRLSEILSETEFKVFSLYLNSHSYNAISSCLSISVKSVDNALSRARIKLRKIYSN